MFGVGDAFVDTLWAPVILDTVGEESLSSALGIVGLIYGIGHVTAPSLSGNFVCLHLDYNSHSSHK